MSERAHSRLVVAAIVAASIGVGAWSWREFARDRVVPKRLGTVVEGQVYRSGQLHPALIGHTLETLGIKTIVALNADDPPTEAATAEAAAAKRLGIDREVFPLEGDGRGDIESYALAIASIDGAVRGGGPVLVHCSAGTYRTGGVIAA